ncbi:MAG: hypothetical protein IT292_05155 [Deltaproteobacteria bacterium]|nr:hypothetical protein [Deltaproteobacteria bacterium]
MLLILGIAFSFIGLPKLRLVGSSQDSNGDTVALIENTDTKEQDVFDVDQSPFNVGNIIDIANDRVTIEYPDGRVEVLSNKNIFEAQTQEGEDNAEYVDSEEYYNQFFENPDEALPPNGEFPMADVDDNPSPEEIIVMGELPEAQ